MTYIVSNGFAVKRSESECFGIKPCGTVAKCLCLTKIFSSLSSDVKGLSKKGVSMEPFDPSLHCISIIIIINSVSKESKQTNTLKINDFQLE